MQLRVAPLIVVVAVSGCGSSTGPESLDVPAIWTDRPEYVVKQTRAGWSAEIPYTFVNRTGEPVYVPNCNGAFNLRLDRWQGTRWVPAWGPILPLCLSAPIVIEAGEALQDTVHFFAAPEGSNAYPQLKAPGIEGTYRLVWLAAVHDYDIPAGGTEVPLRYRTSNSFPLRE